jgi:hypothetical protein
MAHTVEINHLGGLIVSEDGHVLGMAVGNDVILAEELSSEWGLVKLHRLINRLLREQLPPKSQRSPLELMLTELGLLWLMSP